MKCHEAIHALMEWYPLSLDDLEGEIWRDIEGFPHYQISNFGRVKSFQRKQPRILRTRPYFNAAEYLGVSLVFNNKIKVRLIHRLVAQAFIPNPENKPQVNHINGVKADNRVENLEWVTSFENQRHAIETGLRGTGEFTYNSKLTGEQVEYIRENPDNLSMPVLAKMFGVSHTTVWKAFRGKTYKNASGNFRVFKARRVPDEIRQEIRDLYKSKQRGFGSYALAKKFGVSPTTIRTIINEGRN